EREQIHQHQAEPELAEREPGNGADHGGGIDQAAGFERGQEAKRDADQDGEGHGREDQLQRRPDAAAQHLGHRLARTERRTEDADGGMGDVLSGVIAGLLAQGLSLQDAAQQGVYNHGLAADLAAEKDGERGLLASDLMPYLRQLVNW
ncbi:MAG: NAD(P)H-hydrate dehydratase, partial [Methylobacter sp.]|nr:NAD(P)H-hydrate dehydratase [Methylobacter sp.]